jgi:hypothetical protein
VWCVGGAAAPVYGVQAAGNQQRGNAMATSTVKLSKAQILERLAEKVGKPLARMADPSYWSFEDRGRAATYTQPLFAARLAYRMIDGGADPKTVLTDLRLVVQGVENNFIRNLIEEL